MAEQGDIRSGEPSEIDRGPGALTPRDRLLTSIAQVTLSLANSSRYRHLSLADLNAHVVDPLLHDRIVIATSQSTKANHGPTMVGIAIWASVSDEVDASLREQISAGVFPVKLKPQDWVSGKKIWLIDVIAPSKPLRTALFAKLGQMFGGAQVSIHPIVSRLMDQDVFANAFHFSPMVPGEAPAKPH